MKNNFNKSEWTYGEFVLFTYLCMAKADNHLSLRETEELFDRIDLDNFTDTEAHEPIINRVFKVYHPLSDAERLALIRRYAKVFIKLPVEAENLAGHLKAISMADGSENDMESGWYSLIVKALRQE